jgi:hypothetical protein
VMFGGKRKTEKLQLRLPALPQPVLPVPPSLRIMEVASLRSWTYALLVATGISLLCAGGFYALLLSRIEDVPYVVDGSSYGCSPATQKIGVVAPEPQEVAPARPTFEPLAPIEPQAPTEG